MTRTGEVVPDFDDEVVAAACVTTTARSAEPTRSRRRWTELS